MAVKQINIKPIYQYNEWELTDVLVGKAGTDYSLLKGEELNIMHKGIIKTLKL